MKYLGSKNRIAKYILPIILKDRKEGQFYVEPFCGGCNSLDKVTGRRIGNDSNEYLIAFLKSLQGGWTPPLHITKEEYYSIKHDKDADPKMTLWAGVCCSYGGKWFGGYVDDYKEGRRLQNGRLPNHQTESRNSVIKQIPKIDGVTFVCKSYLDLKLNRPCTIYCDPPYEGTTGYKDKFNHIEFWEWCRRMKKEGHTIFISEYNAPEDFTCVLSIKTNTQLGNGCNTGNQIKIEKLFTL